jgi:hypothetical protein
MKRWLVAALVLHASLLLLTRAGDRPPPMPPVRFAEQLAGDAEVELDLDVATARSRESRGPRNPPTERSLPEAPGAPPALRAEVFALPLESADAEPSTAPVEDLVAAPAGQTPAPNTADRQGKLSGHDHAGRFSRDRAGIVHCAGCRLASGRDQGGG